jgi:hypothetical protein
MAHATAGTYYYTFTVPILSLIGISSMEKLFPNGLVSSLQLQMNTTANPPFASYGVATITTQPVISYILDNFSLNLKLIDLGEMASRALMASVNEGKIFLKGSTYVFTSPNIPSNATGTQQLLLQIRNSSVKSIWTAFNTNGSYGTCPNGIFDSFNPTLTYASLEANSVGAKYPNRALNPIQRPGESFSHFALSMGASSASSYNGIIGSENYNCLVVSAPTGSDTRYAVCASALRPAFTGSNNTATNIVSYPNAFYLGFDLEKTTGSVLFNGVNTRSSPPILNVIINSAHGFNILANTFGLVDIVLSFDINSRSVMVFN